MSTRDIEHNHVIDLKRILEEEGIECIRIMVDVAESYSSLGDEQTVVEEREQIKEESKEEEELLVEENIEEAEPYLFPTPSLRKVLPENIREIERFNRIHVLPEKFNFSIDPSAIPRIYGTPKQSYIDALADLVGCTRYKNSLAEYWFLDTLADLLRRAQDDYMDRSSQAVLIVWFCELMKEIQYFDAADRDRMLKRFKENMLAAARFVDAKERLPLPHEIGVSPETTSEEQCEPLAETAAASTSKLMVSLQGHSYECCLRDLTDIVHYIYDLFSTDYQFELVQSVFTFSPDYITIDAPYQINRPKRMYQPKGDGKKDVAKGNGKNTGKKDGKKEGSFNKIAAAAGDDAGHVLELQMREQKELQEIEEREREAWLQKNSILPLAMAVDDEFFQKYFPS